MLLSLHVKNLALIHETEVEFGTGLNILTGEIDMDLFDIETAIQELEDKIKEEIPVENYANSETEHPQRVLSRIYAKICRPQMYFGIDAQAVYEEVLQDMDLFIKTYPEIYGIEKIRHDLDRYVEHEYRK